MMNYSMDGRTYRYFKGTPRFPFGYGLSYTSFKYSDLLLTPTAFDPFKKASLNLSVTVTNTGVQDSDEVCMYV